MTNGRRTMTTVLSAGALMLLAGCAAEKPSVEAPDAFVPRALAPTPVWTSGDRPVTQALVMTARGDDGGAQLIGRQKMASEWDSEPGFGALDGGVGETMRVQLATNNASAGELIRTICDVYLGVDYVLDPAISTASQTVSLDIDAEMTKSDVRDLLGGLASVYGWMLEQRGEIVYFRARGSGNTGAGAMGRSDVAPILRAQAAFDTDQPAIRVKRMRYMPAADATTAVKDLISQGGSVIASGRTLLLVDTVRQTNRLSRVLDALDVPAFEGVEIHTYRLAHRSNSDAQQVLSSITNAAGMTGEQSAISFVAIPGTRDLMAIARDASLLTMARDLVMSVDRPASDERVGAYIYRIQNYEPSQLVRMVSGFFGDRVVADGGQGAPLTAQAAASDPGTPPMRLVLDAEEDLLLVRATPEDFADLLGVLRAIDRPRQQVMLNAIIAEVVLQDNLEFGVDYFLNALEEDGTTIDLFGGTSNFVANPTGTISILGTNALAVIDALRTESDVDVLSQPRLLARDRVRAEFQVGGRVPVVNQDVNSDVGDSTALRRSITYEDTGVTLVVTPIINESGDITLEIEQTIEEVGNDSDLGPEFTTRRINTQVTVPHGQTILLAGIIENTLRTSERKIPILGDVPVAGVAFRSTKEEVERRELLLAITPTIVADPSQASGTVGDFLGATEGLRAALHANVERLPQGALNLDALETPLGGFGDPPQGEVVPARPTEEQPERFLDSLRVPASYSRPVSEDAGEGRIGFWRFGAR